jgi:hypothetical protein
LPQHSANLFIGQSKQNTKNGGFSVISLPKPGMAQANKQCDQVFSAVFACQAG